MIPYKCCNINESNIILLLSHTAATVRRSVLHYFMNEQSKILSKRSAEGTKQEKASNIFLRQYPLGALRFSIGFKNTVTVTVRH